MKRVIQRILFTLGCILAGSLVLLVAIFLLIRLPAVQTMIVQKAVSWMSGKTGTRMEVGSLYLGWNGALIAGRLFAADVKGDTLVSIDHAEVNVRLFALLDNNLEVDYLGLSGGRLIVRHFHDSSYNFSFLQKLSGTTGQASPGDTSASWNVSLRALSLHDVHATLLDDLGGEEFQAHVGDLDLRMKSMGFKPVLFHAKSLSLQNTDVRIIQHTLAAEVVTDTVSGILPVLSLDDLSLDSVHFVYNNKVTNLLVDCRSGRLRAKPRTLDLNRRIISAQRVQLEKASAIVQIGRDAPSQTPALPAPAEAGQGWTISASLLQMKASGFEFDVLNTPVLMGEMDYNHMHFSDIGMELRNALYSTELIRSDIRGLSLKERCGLDIRELTAHAEYNDKHASLANLTLITSRSKVSRSASITCPSITNLGRDPGGMSMRGDFNNCRVGVEDVLLFAPMLKNSYPFNRHRNNTFTLHGQVHGKLRDFRFQHFIIGDGQSTVSCEGHIKGLPEARSSLYDVKLHSLVTTKAGAERWLPENPAGITIPDRIVASGFVLGTLSHAYADLKLRSSSGNIALNGTMYTRDRDTFYNATLRTEEFDAGHVLNRGDVVGRITMKSSAEGRNFTPGRMSTIVNAELSRAEIYGHTYRGLTLTAAAHGHDYNIRAAANDSDLVLQSEGAFGTAPGKKYINGMLDLEGADLHALGLSRDRVRVSGLVQAGLAGPQLADMAGRVSISNLVVIRNGKRYRVDTFMCASINETDKPALPQGLIRAQYRGSLAPATVTRSIVHHVNNYFRVLREPDSPPPPGVRLALVARVLPHPLFSEVIFPTVQRFDGIELTAAFDSDASTLNVVAAAPVVQVAGQTIEKPAIEIHSTPENFKWSASLASLKAGRIRLPLAGIQGNASHNQSRFDLLILDPDSGSKLLVNGLFSVDTARSRLMLHLDEHPVINNEKWHLPPQNFVTYSRAGGLFISDVILSRQTQSVSVQHTGADEDSPVEVTFTRFELGTLSKIIEKDTAILRGLVNGTMEVRHPRTRPAFIAALNIDNIVLMERPVGNLLIEADNLTPSTYTAHLALSGNNNIVDARGTYLATGSRNIDFMVDVQSLSMPTVEAFSGGQIRESSGFIRGDIHVTGTTAAPMVNGDLGIMESSLVISYINTRVRANNAWLKLDPDGIRFNSFMLYDESGQLATVEGDIFTKNFRSMRFDLVVKMNQFTVLNTSYKDNPLYFGRAIISSTTTIKGTEALPVVRVNAKLIEGSHITAVVPASQLTIDRGEGVVILIDTSSVQTIMNRPDTVQLARAMKGVDLAATIEVTRQTTFRLIVDRVSGDSLVVRGDGTLAFAIAPDGNQSLTGTYVLNDGSYNATFQSVIRRDFRLKQGSYITWHGSPTDAVIDVTAVYRTKASPGDLILTDMGGASTSRQTSYRKLTFDVNMMMKGPMLRPEITFAIDMLQKDRNTYGGLVYAKVMSLNSDPQELNRQVFSLLVLNKFTPTGPSNTEDVNAVNTIARNSVNGILSDQLNQISGKYLKDVELNFDIQSTDQYTGNQVSTNTEVQVGVRKDFLNNRMTVQVGSNLNVPDRRATTSNTTSLTGDVIVEYKITEDGRYRFKAFRENQYEGVIDGSLYKTGVGVLYTRDYDSLRELLAKPKEEETEIKPEK